VPARIDSRLGAKLEELESPSIDSERDGEAEQFVVDRGEASLDGREDQAIITEDSCRRHCRQRCVGTGIMSSELMMSGTSEASTFEARCL